MFGCGIVKGDNDLSGIAVGDGGRKDGGRKDGVGDPLSIERPYSIFLRYQTFENK